MTEADLKKALNDPLIFSAKLLKIDGKKPQIDKKADADELVDILKKRQFCVADLKEQKKIKSSPPAYITSTMQQDAFNKLRFAAGRTMRLAQQLYEAGLITYHRTDSVNMSAQAVEACRKLIEEHYGKEFSLSIEFVME